jgi:hypothetical protein
MPNSFRIPAQDGRPLHAFCTTVDLEAPGSHAGLTACDSSIDRKDAMPQFDPQLVRIMRLALDQVMTAVPPDRATTATKAYLAECILKAAAQGQTSYDALVAVASDQLQTILSMLT